jgi:SAM-dependent methyltransferase
VLQQLEAADERFFERVRARLRRGMYTRAGLIRSLWRHAELDDVAHRYAALDLLLAGLFDAGELPDELPSTPEMVAYQPAPGRVILSLLAQVRAGDVVYDLGSGLGRVVISVALLSGACAKGVEFQPTFCAYAARAAEQVHARDVEFIALDAREARFEDGTLFFLYTPFRGALMQRVLARLRAVAAQRVIRVCTFGPCTAELADEAWLALRSGPISPDMLAVFESVPAD